MKDRKEEALSENFSEKKKRGRPRLLHPEHEKSLRQGNSYCDIRTIYNKDYATRAQTVLGIKPNNPPDFPFLWLGDFSKIEIGKSQQRGYRKTILAELGRIGDDRNLIEAATEICNRKPTAEDAIEMIRGWRLGRASVSVSLESTVRKAIENYRKKHSETTDHDIYESLSLLEDEYLQQAMFGCKEK